MFGWVISLSMGGAFILFVNSVTRFPDINDFLGLSRICLFMEDNLIYCVNNNWGFANPLLNYLLTAITGNLLVSQRIISAFFTLSTFILCERIITSTLHIKSKTNTLLVLGFMAVSPWSIESILSVHLDIVSISFVLCGILMTNCKKKRWVILSGFLVSMSVWFRFHYLLFTLLYPVLVYAMNIRQEGLKKGLLSLIGLLPGILIPHILSYFAYGSWFFSNQKLIFIRSIGIMNLSNSFAQQSELIHYSDIVNSISWTRYGINCLTLLFEPMVIFPFLFVCSSFILITIYNKKKNHLGTLADPSEFKICLMIIYILASTLPFIIIRGLTLRLESALFLTAIPIVTFIIDSQNTRRFFFLLIVFLFINWSKNSIDIISLNYTKHKLKSRMTDDIERAIPVEVRRNEYDKILVGLDVYNRQNPYLSFSPEIMGGWFAYFPPLVRKFGRVEFRTLHQNKNYERFKYIILDRHPKFDFWQFNSELLSKGVILMDTKDLIILEIKVAE